MRPPAGSVSRSSATTTSTLAQPARSTTSATAPDSNASGAPRAIAGPLASRSSNNRSSPRAAILTASPSAALQLAFRERLRAGYVDDRSPRADGTLRGGSFPPAGRRRSCRRSTNRSGRRATSGPGRTARRGGTSRRGTRPRRPARRPRSRPAARTVRHGAPRAGGRASSITVSRLASSPCGRNTVSTVQPRSRRPALMRSPTARPGARLAHEDRPPRTKSRQLRRREPRPRCRRRGRCDRSTSSRGGGRSHQRSARPPRRPLQRLFALQQNRDRRAVPRPRPRPRGPRPRRSGGSAPPRRTVPAGGPAHGPSRSGHGRPRADGRAATGAAVGRGLPGDHRARPSPGRGTAPTDCADRRGAAARGDDPPDIGGRIGRTKVGDRGPFQVSEVCLALVGEDLGDRAAGRATRSSRPCR